MKRYLTHIGRLIAVVIMTLLTGTAQAATITWTGAGDANWSTAGNWTGVNTPPTNNDSLVFGPTAGATTLNNDLVFTGCGGITFNSDAPAYTLNGLAIANGGSIGGFTVNSTNAQIINNNFNTLAQNGINVTGTGNLTLGGNFSKSGSWQPNLIMLGTGTLTLNGATSFQPVWLTVNTGTVVMAKTGAGNVGADIVINGGQIVQGGSNQVGKTLTLNAGTFDLNGYDVGWVVSSIGFQGLRGSGGRIVNNGAGTGTNTLQLGGYNDVIALSSFGGTIEDGPTAKIALAVAPNYFQPLNQVLTGNNTYSGGTKFGNIQPNAGVVLSIASMRNIGAAGSRNLTFDAFNSLAGGSWLQITGTEITDSSAFNSITFNTGRWAGFDIADSANTFTLGTAVNSGAGGILGKRGAGTLVLTGAATYTGKTTIQGGTLKVDYPSGGSLNSASAPTIYGGSTLLLLGNTSGDTVQTLGALTLSPGGGSVLIDPNGGTSTTLTLGSLTVASSQGGLLMGKASDSGSGIVAIKTTTSLSNLSPRIVFTDGTSNGYDYATTSGGSPYTLEAYTSASVLTNSGGGAANNYEMTGATTLTGNVAANTLKIASSTGDLDLGTNALTVGGILVTGNSAVQITGSGSLANGASDLVVHQYNSGGLTIGAVLNGANFVKTGTGTLTLSGSNTYTGATYVNGGKLAITDNSQLGAVASGQTLNLNGGTLVSSGTFTLDNGGANKRAITVSGSGGGFEVTNGTLTVSGGITAPSMITKSGAGVLKLTAANNLTAGLRIEEGTLQLGIANALHNGGAPSLVFGNGSAPTLQLNNFDTSVLSLVSTNTAAVVENGVAGTKTISVYNGADDTFAGVLRDGAAGTLALAKNGGGTLTLSGTNTLSGATTVSAGTLALSGVLSNTAITVASGGTFTEGASGVIAGTASLTSSGTTTLYGTNSYSGNTTVNAGTLTLYGQLTNTAITIANGILNLGASGVLADNGAVAINGAAATLAVNGQTETIGRLTGTGGTLDMGTNGALTVNYGNVNSVLASALTGSGTLDIVGTGGLYGNAYYLTGTSSAFTGKVSITNGVLSAATDAAYGAVPGSFVADAIIARNSMLSGVSGDLTISANRGILMSGTVLFKGAQNMIVNSVISGTGSTLIRPTSGYAVTFAGANTYSGGTEIYTDDASSSTLQSGANNSLPYGAGKGNLTITAWSTGTAKLDLNGYNQTVNGLSSGGSTAPTKAIIDNTGAAAATLTVGDNNAAGSFAGIIRNTTGFLSLTKIGTNTLTLSGTNTYAGSTVVNGGTLKLGSASAVAASTSIVVQAKLDVSSVAWTLGAGQVLSGTGMLVGVAIVDGAVAPGSGGIGTLTAGNTVTWNAGVAWPYDLGASSTSDRLAINGDFTMGAGGEAEFVFDLQNVGVAGVYTLVTWTASTTFVDGSEFSAINIPGGLTPTFAVNANDLTLTLAGGDYIPVGSTNTSMAVVGGNVQFGFNIASGALYHVQASTNLLIATDNGFTNITDQLTNNQAGTITYTNTTTDPSRMFRITSP